MAGRGRAWVAAVVLVSAVVVAGCGTDAGGRVVGSSSNSSGLPASASVSVPASVPKDSVLDLNSTKDMTGVVTTVPIGRSPYDKYLPDICQFIPDSVIQSLGYSVKKKGFPGSELVVQDCLLNTGQPFNKPQSSVTVAFFVNNIRELVKSDDIVRQSNVRISPLVLASLIQTPNVDFGVVRGMEACSADWGTFFGAITVTFRSQRDFRADVCGGAVNAARAVVPYMPRSPSQMRASA